MSDNDTRTQASPRPRNRCDVFGRSICGTNFQTHDTEETPATMVPDANVNHIPVLTGGVGKKELREFYSKRFIPQMPRDTQIIPILQTIGHDQLADEMLFKFTHTVRWIGMLLGISLQGDKLVHEHIYWTRPPCWFNSACSMPATFPSRALKARARLWIRARHRTR
jgi:carboxymethylenebutenolidase